MLKFFCGKHRFTFLNSLKTRLIVSALLTVIIILPMVGITLSNAYEKHMMSGIKNELSAYSYAILAVADVKNGHLQMPVQILENQFNVSQSGLYALFSEVNKSTTAAKVNTDKKTKNTVLWQSKSLLAVNFQANFYQPHLGENFVEQVVLANKAHLLYSITISFSDKAGTAIPMTLHIIKQLDDNKSLLAEFRQKLWFTLLILMAVLFSVQLIWLIWSLRPLKQLKRELSEIEQGKSEILSLHYPNELQQLTYQLNNLLRAEQKQRQRYRNALSDLAHSLKTPLSVIKSHPGLDSEINEQVNVLNAMVEHQLTRAQTAGESSWHLGCNVADNTQKIVTSLTKIYSDRELLIDCDIASQLLFKGDEADLLEILGNLLDNAFKAAKRHIAVLAFIETADDENNESGHQQLVILVEDDGPGINEHTRQKILQRGIRADTYQKGHGIGLAIVRDLVTSYQGHLYIERSIRLSGARFRLVFDY